LINVGAWIATDESHDETSGKLCRRTRRASAAADALPEVNPASAEVLAEVPLSPAEEIAAAAEAGLKAFAEWGRRAHPTPLRTQNSTPLFQGDHLFSARSSGELICVEASTQRAG
jgi:hypothetical protein